MDPPLVNESSFSAANPSAYSLLEIWPPQPQQQLSAINHVRPGNAGSGVRIGNSGDGSVDGSTVTEQNGNGSGGRKRKEISGSEEDMVSTSCASDLSNTHKKMAGSRNKDCGSKSEVEASSALGNKAAEKSSKPSDPPKDYIHVRARRGQATDSHSLAERARRIKISERMKILQDLVPGCNKIIGKALVLDEIINYIQSLQCQVEFLSMKLEAVTSRVNMHPHPNIEGFPAKDLMVQPFDSTGLLFPSQGNRVYAHGFQSDWLHTQIGGSFERTT